MDSIHGGAPFLVGLKKQVYHWEKWTVVLFWQKHMTGTWRHMTRTWRGTASTWWGHGGDTWNTHDEHMTGTWRHMKLTRWPHDGLAMPPPAGAPIPNVQSVFLNGALIVLSILYSLHAISRNCLCAFMSLHVPWSSLRFPSSPWMSLHVPLIFVNVPLICRHMFSSCSLNCLSWVFHVPATRPPCVRHPPFMCLHVPTCAQRVLALKPYYRSCFRSTCLVRGNGAPPHLSRETHMLKLKWQLEDVENKCIVLKIKSTFLKNWTWHAMFWNTTSRFWKWNTTFLKLKSNSLKLNWNTLNCFWSTKMKIH